MCRRGRKNTDGNLGNKLLRNWEEGSSTSLGKPQESWKIGFRVDCLLRTKDIKVQGQWKIWFRSGTELFAVNRQGWHLTGN